MNFLVFRGSYGLSENVINQDYKKFYNVDYSLPYSFESLVRFIK